MIFKRRVFAIQTRTIAQFKVSVTNTANTQSMIREKTNVEETGFLKEDFWCFA